jgi:5-methylcytosine-specific restriction endonuclease McrA
MTWRTCPVADCGLPITVPGGLDKQGVKHRHPSGLKRKVWERSSRLQRTEFPLCTDHLARGEYVPAVDVHHTARRSVGGPLLTGELLSLCKACHSSRTARGE